MSAIQLTTSPKRILLIKPSALGDIVHTLPVLNLLKRRWPDAKISWLVATQFADLLDGHPQLEEVIRFDRHGLSQAWWNPAAFFSLLKFIGALRDHHFDLIVDLQGLFRSGLATQLARSPMRVGFANAREGAWVFYTHRVTVDPSMHALDRYLAVAESLGCGRSPVEFHFASTDADRAAIQTIVPTERFAVLLPGTNWPTKRWPVEYFAALVPMLQERFGLSSIVAGSSADSILAKQIPGALDLTGKTNLRELVALLERASVVIANDSGPMHIAAALNRPLVTMFGPTNPARTGPWGRDDTVINLPIDCSPCYSRKCWHQSCLKFLRPQSVLASANVQLQTVSKEKID